MKSAMTLLRAPVQRGLTASCLWAIAGTVLPIALSSVAQAQLPSALYTWGTPNNVQDWSRHFGAPSTSATFDNTMAGRLTITETSAATGLGQAFIDGFNRVRESSTLANGGLDLTGLEFLEYDLGHNGAGSVNVQFYVQAEADPNSAFVALGPDIAVTPGVNTYQVPLSGLTPNQLVYIRALGVNVRDHAALGNLTWSIDEVRSVGSPLSQRDLVTHDVGTAEGGLQGAIVNFETAAVLGNTGQGQTGLSHNPAGPGSLRWTDVGGGAGAAISWGNGTAYMGNSFWNRTTDLSGYTEMIVRMSATGTPGTGETALGVQGFFQKNGFSSFQAADGGAGKQLPIDGQFHELSYSLAGLTDMNVVDQTGINLFGHQTNLDINVDYVRFRTLQSHTLFSWENSFEGWVQGPETGHAHTITSTGATHGATALQIDRTSVPGNPPPADGFVVGSSFTTMDPARITDLATRINDAESVAFDVTFEDQFPINPGYTNFSIIFTDDTGAQYQADTPGFNINGANPGTQATLTVPISAFDDVSMGSTKTLGVDGLSLTSNTLSIAIATSTDGGAVYQIDNFRVLSVDEGAAPIPGDFNGDQMVDADDLADWRASFGAGNGADADADGDSDGADFLVWQRQLGVGSPQVAAADAVPEPTALVLGLFALALPACRRR